MIVFFIGVGVGILITLGVGILIILGYFWLTAGESDPEVPHFNDQ